MYFKKFACNVTDLEVWRSVAVFLLGYHLKGEPHNSCDGWNSALTDRREKPT